MLFSLLMRVGLQSCDQGGAGLNKQHVTVRIRALKAVCVAHGRRRKVDRPFSGFANFRSLVCRWEHPLKMFLAFFPVARVLITLRRL